MDLVLDIGDFRLKGAFFQGDEPTRAFRIPYDQSLLKEGLKEHTFKRCLISKKDQSVESTLNELGIDYTLLEPSKNPNAYGALRHFPQNDCIVVDLGTTARFDLIAADGSCLGSATYPIGPLEKEEEPLQRGVYWGLLGAIERITAEMRQEAKASSNVKVVATGGGLALFDPDDLDEIVDKLDPLLTLTGLHEILKEIKKDV